MANGNGGGGWNGGGDSLVVFTEVCEYKSHVCFRSGTTTTPYHTVTIRMPVLCFDFYFVCFVLPVLDFWRRCCSNVCVYYIMIDHEMRGALKYMFISALAFKLI